MAARPSPRIPLPPNLAHGPSSSYSKNTLPPLLRRVINDALLTSPTRPIPRIQDALVSALAGTGWRDELHAWLLQDMRARRAQRKGTEELEYEDEQNERDAVLENLLAALRRRRDAAPTAPSEHYKMAEQDEPGGKKASTVGDVSGREGLQHASGAVHRAGLNMQSPKRDPTSQVNLSEAGIPNDQGPVPRFPTTAEEAAKRLLREEIEHVVYLLDEYVKEDDWKHLWQA